MGISPHGPKLTFSSSIFQGRKKDRAKSVTDPTVTDGVIISSMAYSRLRCPSASFGGPAPLPLRTKRGAFKAMANRFSRVVVDPTRDLLPYPLAPNPSSGSAILYGGNSASAPSRVHRLQEDLQIALGLTTTPDVGMSVFFFFF